MFSNILVFKKIKELLGNLDSWWDIHISILGGIASGNVQHGCVADCC